MGCVPYKARAASLDETSKVETLAGGATDAGLNIVLDTLSGLENEVEGVLRTTLPEYGLAIEMTERMNASGNMDQEDFRPAKRRPTQRAPHWWESARFWGFFQSFYKV